jgi:1-phosphofructokinase family hexose kinase
MILTVTPNTTLDHVYVVDRLVRGEKLEVAESIECLGGKGGLLSAFAVDLGARSVALGFAAGENGRKLARFLRARGVVADLSFVPGETRRIITIVERRKVGETLLQPVTLRSTRRDEVDLLRRANRWLPKASWLALCGSLCPGCSSDLYARLARLARKHGVPVMIDSRGVALSRAVPEGPAIVKLNRPELEQTVGRKLARTSELVAALRGLVAKGVELAACTLGEGGALAAAAEAAWRITPPKVRSKNATGAGDAFGAGLLTARERGLEWEEALRWAVAAGTGKSLETRTDGFNPAVVRQVFRRVKVQSIRA